MLQRRQKYIPVDFIFKNMRFECYIASYFDTVIAGDVTRTPRALRG